MPVMVRNVEINGFNSVVNEPVMFPEAGQYEVTIIAPTQNDYEQDDYGNKILYGMSASLASGGTFVDADGQDATIQRDYVVDERAIVGTFVLTANADEYFQLSISGNVSGSGIVAYVTKKMSPMVLRSDKGSALTHDEMDNNFRIAKEVETQKKLAVDTYVSNAIIMEYVEKIEASVSDLNNAFADNPSAIEPYYSYSPYYIGVDSSGNVGWGKIMNVDGARYFNVVNSIGEVIDVSGVDDAGSYDGGIITSYLGETGIEFSILDVSDDGSGNLALNYSSLIIPSGLNDRLINTPRFGDTGLRHILVAVGEEDYNTAVGQQFGWNFYDNNGSSLDIIFKRPSYICPKAGYALVTVEKTLNDGTIVKVNRWCKPVIVAGDTEDTIEYVEYVPPA